jgi:cobalt-zinc-cadmium efflux system outer membrane protein
MRHGFAPGAVMLIVTLTGCAPRNAGFDSVDVLLRERAGLDAEWREVSPDSDLDRRVEERLAAPIGAGDAVDIAMLNNGDLQARFEDLGIARAFLVDSSLPDNVEVEGEIGRFGSDRRSDFGFAATTDLTGLMFLPMRRGVAEAGFDASRIETAGRAMEFAYDVRIAFYNYQAAEQLFELDRTVLEAAAASVDAAQRLYEAGNITALELTPPASVNGPAHVAGRS